jgi:hypothetical protein
MTAVVVRLEVEDAFRIRGMMRAEAAILFRYE